MRNIGLGSKIFTSEIQLFVILHFLLLKGCPGIEVVRESFLPHLSLLIRVVPGLPQLLDVAIEELGTVGVLHQFLTLSDEVHHHLPLVLQAVENLVLLLNMLLGHLAVTALNLFNRSKQFPIVKPTDLL